MILLVGLGNPGRDYAGHRHNIGFMALDAIQVQYRLTPWKRGFQGEISAGVIGDDKVVLLKPQTYMNDSGRAVGEAARFYRLSPAEVVVFHDDLDLAPGKLRVKTGGGHAGHNGLRSIDAHLGNPYRRVRLGIGHPGDKALVTPYVLGNFAKAEQAWLEPLIDAVAAEAPRLVAGDDNGFATAVGTRLAPIKPAKPAKRPPEGD